MTTSNVTHAQNSASTDVPRADDPREDVERLISKIRSIEALLRMTCYEAREQFECMHEDLRDDYMAAIVALASESRELANSVCMFVYNAATSRSEAAHG
jgi:hypothetical protein